VRALVNDKASRSRKPARPCRSKSSAFTARRRPATASPWSRNEARAREITEYRQRACPREGAARQAGSRGSLEQMMTQLQDTGSQEQEFPLVIKGDVQGSVEAIAGASRSWAPTRSGPRSSIRAPAASPNPMSACRIHGCRDHRLQRACQQAGARRGRARRRRDPLLQHHLRSGG
jgi:hypothetical protein